MKFGLMYEIQIPEPHYDGIEQERYQQVMAQVELADKVGFEYCWTVEHHCADTDEEAHDVAGPEGVWFVNMAEKLYAPWQGRQVPDSYKFAVSAIQQERTGKTFADHMQSGAFAMGNPASVIKVLKKYQEAGVDQILCFMQMGNLAHARIMNSITLFGRHVIPAFT